ncbi:MAG: low molecular weight protein arginine phosphatase [Gemmatimonadota bacterium]|nr:low molecular weight protein arginine phosphatase [Gemmatimonadota bacterium]
MEKRSRVEQPLRLLFVCTGNTCRSPMAEVIARNEIEQRGWNSVEVRSAGIAAFDTAAASSGALRAAEAHGLDLTGHRATFLTKKVAAWADLILVMSTAHFMSVTELGAGGISSLITSFADEREGGGISESVPDPVGGTEQEYLETFDLIRDLVDKVLQRIGPTDCK